MTASPKPAGALVIDKPRGPTSHDVVAAFRRKLGTQAVGHAGTLDPMATGVLVLAVGDATKLVPYLSGADKAYEATVELGATTDTLDADGKVVARASVDDELRTSLANLGPPLPKRLEAALEGERKRSQQTPPAFSAIQQDGTRAYVAARRGEAVNLEPRPVEVRTLELLGAGLEPAPWMTIAVEVSKGYFVRALARDLAAALGTVGHVTALRRTRSGSFTLDDAISFDTPSDECMARLMSLTHVAERVLPVARLTAVGRNDARFGRAVRPEDLDARTPGPSAWVGPEGELIAIGEVGPDGTGKVLRGFL